MPLRSILAILLTTLFLVGRWNLQRLGVSPDTIDYDSIVDRSVATVLIEPRLWLILSGVPLVLLMEMNASGEVRAYGNRQEARTSVRVFCVLGLYLAATIAWTPSDNPFPAVVDIGLMVLTLLVVERAARHQDFLEAFWIWLERLLLAIGAFALLAQLFQTAPADQPGRLSILGGGPNILGRFLAMLCLLMVAQTFGQSGGLRGSAVWRIIAATVALILLLQTGSRGAFAGLLIGLLALFVVRRMSVKLMVVGAIVIFSFVYLFKVILTAETIEFIDERWLVTTLEEGYLSARDLLLAEAYRLWLERPVVGGGLNSFEYYTFGLDSYPHNLIMEIAQAGGIVAVLLLLAWGVHLVLKSWHERSYYTEIGLSMTALLFGCALFSGDLYDSRLFFILGVLTISSADIAASNATLLAKVNQDRDLGLVRVTPRGAPAEER